MLDISAEYIHILSIRPFHVEFIFVEICHHIILRLAIIFSCCLHVTFSLLSVNMFVSIVEIWMKTIPDFFLHLPIICFLFNYFIQYLMGCHPFARRFIFSIAINVTAFTTLGHSLFFFFYVIILFVMFVRWPWMMIVLFFLLGIIIISPPIKAKKPSHTISSSNILDITMELVWSVIPVTASYFAELW